MNSLFHTIMQKKLRAVLLFLGSTVIVYAQNIKMEFPHFAGKNYDFIIFQGDGAKVVFQGSIPSDGKFTLSVPKEYAPYTGMSRWLITGTKEGGGLDMIIPGKDFSVSCKEAVPNEDNIIYTGNTEVKELNTLYKRQQEILARYDAMLQATRSFPKTEKNYTVFTEESQKQVKAFESLQADMDKNPSYASKFLGIVNITQGIGTEITDTEEKKAQNIARYITDDMDWNVLYTSGHWTGVISSWIDIHTEVLKDHYAFVSDFTKISSKISNQKLYTDFTERTAYFLNQKGKDPMIAGIAPIVTGSGKIDHYEGPLALYTKGTVGTQAPDLVITEHIGVAKDSNHQTTTLKSTDLVGKDYQKALLIFYESTCGHCEDLLRQLPGNYEDIKKKGVRIISVSADKDEEVFKSKAKDFLWKDTFCDFEGGKGVNFKNYGIEGTPTLILIDQSGKIILRTAMLEEVLEVLKKN